MPVYDLAYERQHMIPDREVLRIVECTSGEVQLEAAFCPAPKYGTVRAHWRQQKSLGIHVQFIGGALWLRSDLDWQMKGDHAQCEARLRAGDRKYCSLVMMQHGPAVLSPLGDSSEAALSQTVAWWRKWSARCEYQGPFRENVLRSALVPVGCWLKSRT